MKPIQQHSVSIADQALRNSIEAIQDRNSNSPAIVSISDIHGHLDRARSALLTLRDRSGYDPVVVTDESGQLQWAEQNYVLVFNGDLVDRGDDTEAVLRMVSRLAAQAPPGRVRITLGNHEAIALSADHFRYSHWYAGQANEQDRRALLTAIQDGLVVAAYRGYNYTYAHAGASDSYTTEAVNQQLSEATNELQDALGTPADRKVQGAVINEYPQVLGTGDKGGVKGPGAGLAWLHLDNLSPDAPPQVVGHTKFKTPKQRGEVVCQNVLLRNERDNSPGGEAVFVETPEQLVSITRTEDGHTREDTISN